VPQRDILYFLTDIIGYNCLELYLQIYTAKLKSWTRHCRVLVVCINHPSGSRRQMSSKTATDVGRHSDRPVFHRLREDC